MWLWVIVVLACLLLFVVLILCIPLDLVFSITINEAPTYNIRLLWFFGWMDKELTKAKGVPKKAQVPAAVPEKPKRHISTSTVYTILKRKGMWTQLKRLFAGIFRSFKVKELTARLNVGLGNPADTGPLFAITAPLNSLLCLQPYSITIYPSFDSDIVFEANAYGRARLLPVIAALAILRFLLSPPAIQAARIFVVRQWKKAQ